MAQPLPGTQAVNVENELDIRGLFRALWAGKGWIVGGVILLAAIVLIYTFFARQEWSAMATTDRPTINMLGGCYLQQQFLRNLDIEADLALMDQPSAMDEACKEFTMQLASWDTRRDLWLQMDYCKQRQPGNARADVMMLDDLINNTQFMPGDTAKSINGSAKLIAETGQDVNNLLRQYVASVSQWAVGHLSDEPKGIWAARTVQTKAQVERQEGVTEAIFNRWTHSVEQALKAVQQHNTSCSETDVPADQLPDSELFLLGRLILQARLENLQVVGPEYDLDYDQNRAMLGTLNVGLTLDPRFQTYRYLRTPEEPVKRDSPHRVFLMVTWGIVGVLIGADAALSRRRVL